MRKLHIHNEGLDRLIKNTGEVTQEELIQAQGEVIQSLKAVARLPSVKSIALTPSGLIRVTTNNLYIRTTDCSRERHWDIGSWRLHIKSWSGEVVFRTRDNGVLCFHSGVWHGMTVHPHIDKEGKPCYGTATKTIPVYLQQGDVGMGIMMALEYLRSVNVNDVAGAYLGYLPEVDPATKEVILDNEFSKTPNKRVECTPEGLVDKTLDEYFILYNNRACASCEIRHNINHLKFDGGIYYCHDCFDNKIQCSICNNLLLRDQATQIDGKYVCKRCVGAVYHKCFMCDTVINHDKRLIVYDKEFGGGRAEAMCAICRAALPKVNTTATILDQLTPVKTRKTLIAPYEGKANEIAYHWTNYETCQVVSAYMVLTTMGNRSPNEGSSATYLLEQGKDKTMIFKLLDKHYILYHRAEGRRITSPEGEENETWENVICIPRVLFGKNIPEII